MQKFLAYSKKNAFFLAFMVGLMFSTPFYWAEGGTWILALVVLILVIYTVAVFVKIRRGQL